MNPARRKSAAVLLMLFEKQGETHIVVTRRTNSVATHKGQISLPGGAKEAFDADLKETALRETEEELGIDRRKVRIVGQLPETPTHASNYTITPFVARLQEPPSYIPDSREVADVIEVPIRVFSDPSLFWTQEATDHEGTRDVYYFRYGETIIWGATARIMREFVALRAGEWN